MIRLIVLVFFYTAHHPSEVLEPELHSSSLQPLSSKQRGPLPTVRGDWSYDTYAECRWIQRRQYLTNCRKWADDDYDSNLGSSLIPIRAICLAYFGISATWNMPLYVPISQKISPFRSKPLSQDQRGNFPKHTSRLILIDLPSKSLRGALLRQGRHGFFEPHFLHISLICNYLVRYPLEVWSPWQNFTYILRGQLCWAKFINQGQAVNGDRHSPEDVDQLSQSDQFVEKFNRL